MSHSVFEMHFKIQILKNNLNQISRKEYVLDHLRTLVLLPSVDFYLTAYSLSRLFVILNFRLYFITNE